MRILDRFKNKLALRFEKKNDPNDIDHENAMKWFERRKDNYERLISAISPYVDREGTIFDIGANIGYFSLLLMERIDFRGSALLFEPVPNLATLCKMTFRDKPYKVQLFDFALSDEDGSVEFFTAQDGNIGWNTMISNEGSTDMTKIRVKVCTFDSIGIKAQPSFIKIDVEGAEFKVFQGMFKSMKAWDQLPVILCEVAWGQSHPSWKKELLAFDELKTLGYDFYNLENSRIEIADLQETTDVICVPKIAKQGAVCRE